MVYTAILIIIHRRKMIMNVFSRRSLLMGAGGLVTTCLLGRAHASNFAINSRKHIDAIIIGGGLAGVTAARELADHGYNSLIIEAGNSLGGKVSDADNKNGEWIHFNQVNIKTEIKRYGLEIEKNSNINSKEDTVVAFDALFSTVDEDKIKPYHPDFYQKYKKYNQINVMNYMRSINFPVDQRGKIDYFLNKINHSGRNDSSLLGLLKIHALSNYNTKELIDTHATYKIKQGLSGLIDTLYEDSLAEGKFNSYVTKISRNDQRFMVYTHHDVYEAQIVICALPRLAAKNIKFELDIHQSDNDVIYANSDIAYGWRGYFDGAVESGLSAGWAANKRIKNI